MKHPDGRYARTRTIARRHERERHARRVTGAVLRLLAPEGRPDTSIFDATADAMQKPTPATRH